MFDNIFGNPLRLESGVSVHFGSERGEMQPLVSFFHLVVLWYLYLVSGSDRNKLYFLVAELLLILLKNSVKLLIETLQDL